MRGETGEWGAKACMHGRCKRGTRGCHRSGLQNLRKVSLVLGFGSFKKCVLSIRRSELTPVCMKPFNRPRLQRYAVHGEDKLSQNASDLSTCCFGILQSLALAVARSPRPSFKPGLLLRFSQNLISVPDLLRSYKWRRGSHFQIC